MMNVLDGHRAVHKLILKVKLLFLLVRQKLFLMKMVYLKI